MEAEIERLRLEDAKRQEQDDQLVGVCMVLNARLAELEDSNEELRRLQNLDPPKPSVKTGFIQVKTAAKLLDCSITWIHHLASDKVGKLKRRKVGGTVFIEMASIEDFCLNFKTSK